jgi:hypothetical protein
MSAFTAEFAFDELPIIINGVFDKGLLAYGYAELEDAGDGDFTVRSIRLDSGAVLSKPRVPSGHAVPFEGELFNRIAAAIENPKSVVGKQAELFWSDAMEGSDEPDPDYLRDRRRDDALHFA